MPLKPTDPTNLVEVDRVNGIVVPTLADYVAATSDYILHRDTRTDGEKKAAQIRMSAALGRFLLDELQQRIPTLNGSAGETKVAGALRSAQADVAETHPLDGLRLGIEIKPVNVSVGRAIWNRFGDIRTFSVNLHLKFPFAVIGGVLAIPTWEHAKRKSGVVKKPTSDAVNSAVKRLQRAGGRLKESDAPHLLEGIWVLHYDPDTRQVHPSVPPTGSGLRLPDFLAQLVDAYEGRFE